MLPHLEHHQDLTIGLRGEKNQEISRKKRGQIVMKLRAKTLVVALVGALSLTLLAGCNSSEQPSEVSDTVRWINATCAVLTENNGGDHNLLGGMEPGDDSQATTQTILREYWDVTDRESADQTLDWILNEGHRADFVDTMESLKEGGAEEESEEDLAAILGVMLEDDEAGLYLAQSFSDYLEFGPTAIDAWDYSRAVSLLGWYYLAGFYTETEALDKALEIAQTVQTNFSSWDEFNESYCRGYAYWASTDSSDRWATYETLKAQKDGPYQLPWDTPLEKTW